MKKFLLFLIIICLSISIIGCKRDTVLTPTPTPTPIPTLPIDYLQIPDYVSEPDRIAYWHRVLGSAWTDDEVTTGYSDYKFTPIEFTLSEIPDANKPGNTIHKTPYQGDCDDFASFNAYVAYVQFHYQPYIVYILNGGNIHMTHAICYGIIGGRYHFWDNTDYRGAFDSVDDFRDQKYPGWIIYFHKPLKEVLEDLYRKGHLEYAPVQTARKSTSKTKACPVDGVCK